MDQLPKSRQIWQPAKSNLLARIPGLSGKDSLNIPKRPQNQLRRSKSFSDLQRRPISDRNGAVIHAMLPKPDTLKSSNFSLGPHTKENKQFVRTLPVLKRPGAIIPSSQPAAKQQRIGEPSYAATTIAKSAAGKATLPAKSATKAVPTKKIAPYDYKARFNDLLEKHKPMKEEYLELKRNNDTMSDELLELREEWESYATTIDEYKKNAETDRTKILSLTSDHLNLSKKYNDLQREKELLEERLRGLTSELDDTKVTLQDTSDKLHNFEIINRQHEELIAKQVEDIDELQESTQKLHWERRTLHNKLQDMKGNIRVICRVRPALAAGKAVAHMCFPDACTIELERLEPGANRRLTKHDFKFDRVFGPTSNQEDVWEEVSCLVQSALDGYNVCIFAYGQTGSGKTYTMEGNGKDPGVIPRTCTMVFESIKQLSRSGWEYKVHASFLEIYNEQLYDLLQPSRDPRELDIRMTDSKGSDVYVTNLTEQEVLSANDLLRLAARAQQSRQTAATAGNERSSRSHSVARVRLEGKHTARGLALVSRLCLVDLAGSESAKLTQRIKETKNINRSLSELGQVILALQQKQEHIPFRNSKLTRLLEPQLGGAAKALLVAAAAPYEDCEHESLSTLRFATQVGHCSTATARRNIALANPTAAPH